MAAHIAERDFEPVGISPSARTRRVRAGARTDVWESRPKCRRILMSREGSSIATVSVKGTLRTDDHVDLELPFDKLGQAEISQTYILISRFHPARAAG